MYYESPYKVYIDSYESLRIETEAELDSVKFEHEHIIHDLTFLKTKTGYTADISELDINLQAEMYLHLNHRHKQVVKIGMITTTEEFDRRHASNQKLGAIYSKTSTTFRIWTPVATELILVISQKQYLKMEGNGSIYELTVQADLEGADYYYLVKVNGNYRKVVDPYALNVTRNTESGIVIDEDKVAYEGEFNANDKDSMVIYETSVFDFTSDVNLDFKNKGKFLGFCESQTINGEVIGIDYVKELGISHVQIMPIYDFGSVNEQLVSDDNYNWGYDPIHYNVPEGSYVIGNDSYSRINECKQMIAEIKGKGLGLIMDVVYNHVYDASTFNYNLLVPNYYFRFEDVDVYSDGSLCGNEVASERSMVRRYIVDSIKTWLSIYGIDGIRMDLMGLTDIETVKTIASEAEKINPNFMIYGEGWDMAGMLDKEKRATQINANQLPSVGYFNDDLRNFIKGNNSDFEKVGYVQGNKDEESLAIILSGKALDDEKSYVNAHQLINYVSCHDDHTLYDYLKMKTKDEDGITQQIIKCYELIFQAKGIPFIHSGCEFKRTKDGMKNTYNASRQLNAIKWHQIIDNKLIITRLKDLIKEKKSL